jgi:NMT1/THI5 like
MNRIRILASHVSHTPLHFTFRDSGVAERYGFELEVDVARVKQEGRETRDMADRAPGLLKGDYQFVSGLHHEPYVYRAKGDKRLVYLAQTQNEWDDRMIARPGITEPKHLEGQKVLTSRAPCVGGNLMKVLTHAGVDISKVDFVISPRGTMKGPKYALDQVVSGEVGAANVDMPFDLQARKLGLNVVELPSLPVIHNTTICASTDFLQRNEEAVTNFLKGLIAAIHFFKTQKDRVCEILSAKLAPIVGIQADDEIEYLHEQWSRLLLIKPYPHPLAVWNVYDLDVAHDTKVNFIGPFEPWDTHYLRAIDNSGFIEELEKTSVRA